MASAYKTSSPFIFLSTQQLLLMILCLAFMMPFITTVVAASAAAGTSNTSKRCIKAEQEALLMFKAEMIYDRAHPISSWGYQSTDDCCQWAGVHCDNNSGHVVRLNLQRRRAQQHQYDLDQHLCSTGCNEGGLSGNISQALIGLQQLRYLDLSFNCFLNISIPKLLGLLENLVHLDLSCSGFTGVIPHEIGNLTKLRYLNVATANGGLNSYKVDDAEWLSGLSSLRYLYMDGANFSGVNNVIQSLNKLHHLKQVSLFHCSMNNIPESLTYLNFTSLTFLDIGSNVFRNASIPEWLFRLPNLRGLRMVDCGFTGTVPSSIGKATSLQVLDLSYNGEISGDIPRGFGDLCNLKLLYLNGTFVGKILEDLGDAFSGCISRNLNVFSFVGSSLQGPLPDWLGEFRNLASLYLSNNALHGSIPESLGRLSRLQDLDLSGNTLNGSIPESLGRLSKLQTLYLGGNGLNGPIPDSLGRLSGLQSLDLSINRLNGSIPASLGKLSRLQVLDLQSNALSGSIPESLGRLSGLQVFALANNALNGPIPESLWQLPHLVTLEIRKNNFNYSSTITEAHLANLTSLQYLSMDHLILNISSDWIPSFQANHIYLSYCRVGPKFPLWLASQVNLNSLDISNAGIKDSMPDWFWNMTSIAFLDLSDNEIKGRLPQRLEFGAQDNNVEILLGSNHFEGSIPYFPSGVYALDLSNNSFSGIIPSDLGNFGGIRPRLNFLALSSNNLTGSIPNSLCHFVDLQLLGLTDNHLEGAIPNCWNNLTGLRYMLLANNSLVGEVPNSLESSSQSLQMLHLSNNQLHGEFPSFFKNCSSIITLTLDHNNLSGSFPNWVGKTMTSLKILTLKKNKFSGNLPLLSNLIKLHFLDLSHNLFAGSIPQSYGNLTGMTHSSVDGGALYNGISESLSIIINVSTKGIEQEYGVSLSTFKFIDLSANNLSGKIPREIVNLVGLQNLDLSCNNLTGEIPSDIGLMQSLESLDLSRNELNGSIPLGLSTLNFLGSLNLSHNNLSGKIPYAGHLTTFNNPSIYAGNLKLCGAPLDKNCTSDEPPSNSYDKKEDDDDDDDDDNLPVWFYTGLMPGLVFGFWLVWGIILFKKKWRHNYFRFLDNVFDMLHVKRVITVHKIKRALGVMKSE